MRGDFAPPVTAGSAMPAVQQKISPQAEDWVGGCRDIFREATQRIKRNYCREQLDFLIAGHVVGLPDVNDLQENMKTTNSSSFP